MLGQEEVELIVANIYNYISVLACKKKTNHNMLLAAPSGCGKTEIYRALRDLFGLILLMWIGDSRHNRKGIGDCYGSYIT